MPDSVTTQRSDEDNPHTNADVARVFEMTHFQTLKWEYEQGTPCMAGAYAAGPQPRKPRLVHPWGGKLQLAKPPPKPPPRAPPRPAGSRTAVMAPF